MGPIPFTKRRGKKGNYYFRRRAPKDALPVLRRTVWRDHPGRTHWEEALGTTDAREAFSKAHVLVEKTDALIADALGATIREQEAANEAQRRAQALTDAESRVVSLDPADRAEVTSAGGVEALAADALDNAGWANMMANAEAMGDGMDGRALSHAEALAERVDAAGNRAAAVEAKRIVQTQARILAKLGLDLDEKLDAFRETEPGLGDILDHLIRERGLPAQTEGQYRYAVRRFNELHGDIPAIAVTRDHYRTFADAIRELPAGRAHRVQDLPFKAAVELARAKGLPTITDATRSKHMTAIKTVMAHALGVGLIEANPLAGLRLPKRRQRTSDAARGARDSFTAPELSRIERAVSAAYAPSDDDF